MINQSPQQYTVTMAKLFADQGYLKKAAEIYRYLIHQYPEREDIKQALNAVERQIMAQPSPTRKDVELMLREWVDLLKKKKQKKK